MEVVFALGIGYLAYFGNVLRLEVIRRRNLYSK